MNNSCINNAEVLKRELELVGHIYGNTVAQSGALAEKDDQQLKNLLDKRRKYVDQFAALEKVRISLSSGDESCDESANAELERSIRSIIHQIFEQNAINVENANQRLNELSKLIRHVKTGQIALQKGYFKKIPQQYGYFFDKKVGTGSYRSRA